MNYADLSFPYLPTETLPVLVAVSGGADSVALALVLHRQGVPFAIGHFSHHIREGVAQHEKEFVNDLANRLKVAFHHGEANIPAIVAKKGGNVEERARTIRYAWLHSIVKKFGYEFIYTAHTQSDNTESVLMQLTRGSASASGIRVVRGIVHRPLLPFTGDEVRAWLTKQGEAWITDATNFDTDRTRTWLRHEIIPAIEQRVPHLDRVVARWSVLQSEQMDAVKAYAQLHFPTFPIRTAAARRVPAAVLRTALVEHAKKLRLAVDASWVQDIVTAVQHQHDLKLSLSKDIEVRVQQGFVDFVNRNSKPPVAEGQFRPVQPGDKIRFSYGTKLLSDVFTDEKISEHEREGALVRVVDGYIQEVQGLFEVINGSLRWRESDRMYMTIALEEALLAEAEGEVPVGAVVVSPTGEVLGRGRNRRETGNLVGHAEILALQEAAAVTGDWRLENCTLYVTLEPCPMCAGAVVQSHLARVVFGADNHRDGALGTVMNLFGYYAKRSLSVTGGVLAHKSAKLLEKSFKAARVR